MARTPTAAIYFDRRYGEMAKDLASRVRNDGPNVLMIWGERFRSEKDLEDSVGAVLIQRSLGTSGMIAAMYEQFAAGVEIHFITDEGEFEEEVEGGLAIGKPTGDTEAPTTEDKPDEPQATADGEAQDGPHQQDEATDAAPEEQTGVLDTGDPTAA